MRALIIYLFQVGICHALFYFLYRALYSNLGYFNLSRFYLLGATVIGFIIPLLSIGVWRSANGPGSGLSFLHFLNAGKISQPGTEPAAVTISQYQMTDFLFPALFIIYLIGCVIMLYRLVSSLMKIRLLIKNNENVLEDDYRIVRTKNGPAFFSFMKCIFVNENRNSLKPDEYKTVLLHEQAHVKQKHSYDLLLMEIAGAVCWYNPFLRKLKSTLCQVHEYLADRAVVNLNHDPEAYSKLIVRLSHQFGAQRFVHQFSLSDLKNRIDMLYLKKQNKMQALRFIAIIPLLALMLLAFSFTERSEEHGIRTDIPQQKLIISAINWEGNKVFTDEYLTRVLAIKPGDVYDKKQVENNLSFNPMRQDIAGLYMDLGYVYFRLEPAEVVTGNKIVLNMKIDEGNVAYFNDVAVKGNSSISTPQILKMIDFKKGDKFSRSKLIQSQEKLNESNHFREDRVHFSILPLEDASKINVEIIVEEK